MTNQERRKKWEARLAAYRTSGQTAAVWCANHDLKPQQLWYWMRKFKTMEETANSSTKWLSVEVDEQPEETRDPLLVRVGPAVIEIQSGYDSALLAEVVRTLRSLC